jgi:hypothetical protein
MTIDKFFEAIDSDELKTIDRAIALLWFVGRGDPALGATAREICDVVERHGHPKQNVSRLDDALAADRRTARAAAGAWRLVPRARRELDVKLAALASMPRKAAATDTVLPRELFKGTRRYLEAIVHQLNASYDCGLYDCCAVMCRRLLETLLIEVYEAKVRAAEIKGSDGHFLMFAPLLTFFEEDNSIHASRNAIKGLRDFKQLGDLSAHNRRFNAHKNDIDRIRDGLRIAAGELVEMAGMKVRSQ